MNIDYGKIIEQANARKEALEALASQLALLPEVARQLIDDLAFFEEIGKRLCEVDLEGKGMLPPELVLRLRVVCHATANTTAALVRGAGYQPDNNGNLPALVALLKQLEETK